VDNEGDKDRGSVRGRLSVGVVNGRPLVFGSLTISRNKSRGIKLKGPSYRDFRCEKVGKKESIIVL